MSAFIVADKTINQIISKLVLDREGEYTRRKIKEQFGLDPKAVEDDRQALGSLMMALNINAVNQRYEEPQGYEDYQFRLEVNSSKLQAFKSLQCWLYQCSEGNVPESELYQLMERVKDAWSDDIIRNIPEYDSCQWDAI